jgi:hypothetical protein
MPTGYTMGRMPCRTWRRQGFILLKVYECRLGRGRPKPELLYLGIESMLL